MHQMKHLFPISLIGRILYCLPLGVPIPPLTKNHPKVVLEKGDPHLSNNASRVIRRWSILNVKIRLRTVNETNSRQNEHKI